MTTQKRTWRTYLREYSNPFRQVRQGTGEPPAPVVVAGDGLSALAGSLLRGRVGRDEAVRALTEKAELARVLDKVHMISHGDGTANPVLIPVGTTHREVIELIANAPD